MSIRVRMIQNWRKIPWTRACTLSFTVGWWKECVAVIGQVGMDMSLPDRTTFQGDGLDAEHMLLQIMVR